MYLFTDVHRENTIFKHLVNPNKVPALPNGVYLINIFVFMILKGKRTLEIKRKPKKPYFFSCAKNWLSHCEVIKHLLLSSVLGDQNM